ncbi:MAG: OadG family protein [Deltaproteobacteria bacterium]
MDPSATSGLNVTVVGMGVVFTALMMIVAVVSVMARLLGTTNGAPGPASAEVPQIPDQQDHSEGELRARVAAAVYAFHRRRSVAVRGPQPSSAWSRAGRGRQVMRFPDRILRKR